MQYWWQDFIVEFVIAFLFYVLVLHISKLEIVNLETQETVEFCPGFPIISIKIGFKDNGIAWKIALKIKEIQNKNE